MLLKYSNYLMDHHSRNTLLYVPFVPASNAFQQWKFSCRASLTPISGFTDYCTCLHANRRPVTWTLLIYTLYRCSIRSWLVACGLLRFSLVFMLLLSTIGIIFQEMAVDINFLLLRSRLVDHGVLFWARKRSLPVLTRLLRYGLLDFA